MGGTLMSTWHSSCTETSERVRQSLQKKATHTKVPTSSKLYIKQLIQVQHRKSNVYPELSSTSTTWYISSSLKHCAFKCPAVCRQGKHILLHSLWTFWTIYFNYEKSIPQKTIIKHPCKLIFVCFNSSDTCIIFYTS